MRSSDGALSALFIVKSLIRSRGSLHSELERQEQVQGMESELNCII